jgi:hypothetical protein
MHRSLTCDLEAAREVGLAGASNIAFETLSRTAAEMRDRIASAVGYAAACAFDIVVLSGGRLKNGNASRRSPVSSVFEGRVFLERLL